MYSKEERERALASMQTAADRFYREAAATGCHPFIEFCGLLNEYIKVCKEASDQNVDFMSASRHTNIALPIERFHAQYLGEKIGCIYGTSFKDPDVFRAFVGGLELSIEVKIEGDDDLHSRRAVAQGQSEEVGLLGRGDYLERGRYADPRRIRSPLLEAWRLSIPAPRG